MGKDLEGKTTITTDSVQLNNDLILTFKERAGKRINVQERGRNLYVIAGLPGEKLIKYLRGNRDNLLGVWYELRPSNP